MGNTRKKKLKPGEELLEDVQRQRSEKRLITPLQKIQLYEYLKPRYWKIMGRWKEGYLSETKQTGARQKFFKFARTIGYNVKDEKTLRKNIAQWRRLALDEFNSDHPTKTGGGRRKELSETKNMIIEMCTENRSVGTGAERVNLAIALLCLSF